MTVRSEKSHLPEQEPVSLTVAYIKDRVSGMKNWTAAGPDIIHTYSPWAYRREIFIIRAHRAAVMFLDTFW